MAYQFKREPLTPVEADKLYQACNSVQEKLIIWILLDTGLRVSELCSLTRKIFSGNKNLFVLVEKVDHMENRQRKELYQCLIEYNLFWSIILQ